MCYNPQLVRDKPLGAAAFVNLVYHYGSHDDPGHGLSTLSTALQTVRRRVTRVRNDQWWDERMSRLQSANNMLITQSSMLMI